MKLPRHQLPTLFISALLLTVSAASYGQVKPHKTMHFNSRIGNFTLETPIGWKEIMLRDSDSFDGLIALGHNDTLHFSFGAWRSRFNYGHILHTEDRDMDSPVKIYPNKIDGCIAYRNVQQEGNNEGIGNGYAFVDMGWPRCFYIDTVYVVGRDAMRFDLWGTYLTEPDEALFYQVVKTIHFGCRIN
jgi:hypothetical protein